MLFVIEILIFYIKPVLTMLDMFVDEHDTHSLYPVLGAPIGTAMCEHENLMQVAETFACD